MKTAGIALALLLIVLPSLAQKKPRAREYYEELYKAGRLDQLADLYACFPDLKDDDTFFIFGESTQTRDQLEETRKFNALPKQNQDLLNQDVMILRFYQKGVPSGERVLMTRDGKGWASQMHDLNDKGDKTRGTFQVDLRTLHFYYGRETIFAPPPPSRSDLPRGVTEIPRAPAHVGNFGVCEQISTRIKQRGL